MTAPRLLVLGLSHKTAPVALRERLAFRGEQLPSALAHLASVPGVQEAAILSTCNRVELYVLGDATVDPAPQLRVFLAEFHGLRVGEFEGALYESRGAEAARHLFEVVASLDSQVLGETEILGQAREAYRVAAQAGAAGPVLRALFERAFFISKELRGDGGIGHGQASVSSAAVQLAGKIFEHLRGHQVLVVGTGEMAAGIVRALRAAGLEELLVTSRTAERAEAFAREEGGRSCRIEDLGELLKSVDIVLVSTAAPHFLIGAEHVRAAQPFRRGRPLFLIDISVPRNVEPGIQDLPDTFLYDIDDLEKVAGEGRKQREQVAERWRPRLVAEARMLLNELSAPLTGETARLLLEKVEQLKRAELDAMRADGTLAPAEAERLERALEHLLTRLLHGPLATLKEAAREGDGVAASQWVTRLFRLHAQEPDHAVHERKEAAEPKLKES